MKKLELQNKIHLGKHPATIYYDIVYNGIYRFIRIIEGNKVFLDFDSGFDTEGGLRIRFIFDSFDEMVCSIEKFVGKKLSKWKPIFDEGFVLNKDCNWDELKKDLYNKKIPLLTGYQEMSIGDMYWRGIYSHSISPDSSMDEINKWFVSQQFEEEEEEEEE